jgi:hypothetical protein
MAAPPDDGGDLARPQRRLDVEVFEAQHEVLHRGRRQRVERGVEAAHGGGEHGGDDHRPDALGQHVDDEARHKRVGLAALGDRRLQLRQVDEGAADGDAEGEVEHGEREAPEAVEDKASLGVLERGRAQLALGLALISTVVGGVEEEAADEVRPQRGT